MRLLKQFMIILMITFLGEGLKYILPLPIPASIYGMVILFVCLLTGAAEFLIEIMPVMFIPAGVGLMVSWGVLKPMLLPVSIITIGSLFTVIATTGLISQWIIRKGQKREENTDE